MIIGMTWLRTHNPKIDWRTGKVEFTRCPTTCQGKRSLQSAFSAAIDSTSIITQYSHYFDTQAVNRLAHHINSKETTSMQWAIEALKKKTVLTLCHGHGNFQDDFLELFSFLHVHDLYPPFRLLTNLGTHPRQGKTLYKDGR